MVLLEKSKGVLEYDESAPCVIGRFTGFMKSDEFRAFLLKGLEYCIQYKPEGKDIMWLADTRSHSVQQKEDTDWVATHWNPKALEAGVRYVAFIVPENVFGEMAVKNYMNQSTKYGGKTLHIGMFSTIDQAKEWFKKRN
ncbi:hypothetical protein LVD15_02965 [Fulvivirga maritima]|uniref:hypothetical protein n=1 Tax=Fulvivirga maritima TaxID=2904247 RepID=UPI001F428331|nr:hypothetical protein [Fulvivirga maritima]UII27409.1 hypothetical protein LVD15_02965 [Fulvivirga maritima]